MAFTTVDTWPAGQCERRVPRWSASSRSRKPVLGVQGALITRKFSASLLSGLIHFVLFWLLFTRLAGGQEDLARPGGGGDGLTVIDLSGAQASGGAVSTQMDQASAVAQAQKTEIETTKPTDLPKAEWAVSRVTVQVETLPSTMRIADNAAVAGPSGAGATGSGENAGNIGGGVAGGGGGSVPYDPFAGAAPLRRAAGNPGAVANGSDLLTALDRNILKGIVSKAGRAAPQGSGTVELSVNISPEGIVLAVSSIRGSAPQAARDALARGVIGKRLFRISRRLPGTRVVDLPPIEFG